MNEVIERLKRALADMSETEDVEQTNDNEICFLFDGQPFFVEVNAL